MEAVCPFVETCRATETHPKGIHQVTHSSVGDKSKVSFGIGTFCSNDTCAPALNIVIKLQYVNGRPVAKLSDTPEKAMCQDPDYVDYLKRAVAFRLKRETL